jgi:uncharacterized protein YwgA
MAKDEAIDLEDEEKLLLYVIGALDYTPLRSKIKLQKIIFLVSNVFRGFQQLLHYEPHYLGPYSETLENTLNSLIRLGYIEAKDSNFSLTKKGVDIFKALTPKPELVEVIEDFKGFLNDLSDNEILAFIYASYPEYISESVKWDKLKPRRVNCAISLLRNGKVSFGKAAEIAGLNQIEFDRILKGRNLRWRE